MAKCALFDLDGTLINTITDLGNACDYALSKYGIKSEWTEDDYKIFVGNGMGKLVERAFDGKIDEKELPNALEIFKKKYDETYLDFTKPYDQIVEILDELKNMGIKIAVVTNKAQDSAVGILNILFGENYFDAIVGQVDGVPTKPDPAEALVALKKLNCSADEAMYFGDTNVDMKTAKNAGVEAIGVTWGFRSFAELFNESPSLIIDEPKQILKLF